MATRAATEPVSASVSSPVKWEEETSTSQEWCEDWKKYYRTQWVVEGKNAGGGGGETTGT